MKVKTGNSCVDSYLPFFDNIMKEEVWLKTSNIPAALLVSCRSLQSIIILFRFVCAKMSKCFFFGDF